MIPPSPPRPAAWVSRTDAGGERSSSLLMFGVSAAVIAACVLAIASQRWSVALVVAALPMLAVLLSSDLRVASSDVRSDFIPAVLIAATPLLSRFSLGVGGGYVGGFAVLGAFAWLLVLLRVGVSGSLENAAFRQRAGVLAVPLTGIILATAAAQVTTGEAWSPVLQLTHVFSLYSLIAMLGFFLLSCQFCSSRVRVERLMWWCMFINVVQVAVAVGERFAPQVMGDLLSVLNVRSSGGIDPGGFFGDSELSAELFVLLWIWSLCFMIWGRGQRQRIGAGILAAAYLVGILTMVHFSALFGATGATALVLAFASLQGVVQRGRWVVVVVLIGGVLLLFGSSSLVREIPSGVVGRLASTTGRAYLSTEGGMFANRQTLYDAAAHLATHGMPITGYGMEHTRYLGEELGSSYVSTHSIWLWGLLSAGVAGLVFTILLFAMLLTSAFRAWLRVRTGVSVALLVSVLFLALDQSKVDAVRLPVYAFFIFGFFGMVASYWRSVRTETKMGASVDE